MPVSITMRYGFQLLYYFTICGVTAESVRVCHNISLSLSFSLEFTQDNWISQGKNWERTPMEISLESKPIVLLPFSAAKSSFDSSITIFTETLTNDKQVKRKRDIFCYLSRKAILDTRASYTTKTLREVLE